MKVCMYVCMYVCPAACRQTYTTYHPKIWHGFLISPGLGTKPGATRNVDPQPRPQPRPLLLLSSLDHSARDSFTIVL